MQTSGQQTLLQLVMRGVMVKIRVGVRHPVSLPRHWLPARAALILLPPRGWWSMRLASDTPRSGSPKRMSTTDTADRGHCRAELTITGERVAVNTSAGDGLNGLLHHHQPILR